MKLVIFGAGKYYLNRKEQLFRLCEEAEIVCYIDNKADENTIFEGRKVLKPYQLNNIIYDKILLMSKNYLEMRSQLIALGCLEESIWTWDQFICEMSHGKFQFFGGESGYKKGRSILIISTDLGYNGGSIAAAYAAKELSNRYEVVLAAPRGDIKFVKEMVAYGISILICPAIPYLGNEEIHIIKKFDVIIVNVFQLLPVVCQVSKLCPTFWWIHEPKHFYKQVFAKYPQYENVNSFKKVNIKAVSKIAQSGFNSYYPQRIFDTMAYGIPDMGICERHERKTITFALVGAVIENKAQDIYIQAAKLLDTPIDISFRIIGSIGEDNYCNKIRHLVENDMRFKIEGKCTREEMAKIYREIDVVVCPSWEDSLPIVMTESMMYGKVCIASDKTGTADFIEDGVNGLICKAGDVANLSSKMQWILDNTDKLDEMGRKARKTYEEHFTMDKFSNRLEAAIQETIEMYGE